MAKALLYGLLLAILAVSPFIGTVSLDPAELLNPDALSHRVFFDLRLPRIGLAFFAGASLALSGLLFQNIFRNVLMTPYTLGVSGGAVLGAGIAIKLGLGTLLFGIAAVSLFGFLGAVLTVMLLVWLSRYLRHGAQVSLLLLGIALSFFYTSALMLLYFISDFVETATIMRFTMGSLSTIGYRWLLPVAVTALLLLGFVWLRRFELQLLGVSDINAQLKGVDTRRLGIQLLLAASLAVGTLVSVTGPIGFVGLIVPHIVRLVYRRSVERLILPTFVLGGLFLVAADALGRIIGGGSEIPISIITALVGGPFFIYLILKSGK
jgi:iron complex transport system permease protein